LGLKSHALPASHVFANLGEATDRSNLPVHHSLDVNRSYIDGSATAHSFAPDHSAAQVSFTGLNASHWSGSPSHPILNFGQEDIQYWEDAPGSTLHRGFGSQFHSGTYINLVHDDEPSANPNPPANAGLQQRMHGSMNGDPCMALNSSLGFSPSPLQWNLGLGGILPGSATDVANYAEVDGFPSFGVGCDDEFNAPESQANPGMLGISGPTPPIQGTGPALQLPPAVAATAATAHVRIPCRILGCSVAFNRDGDRIRHEASVHGLNQVFQLYLCPIAECPKSWGAGYTRKDKLTEHMWKKHGDLGFVKRVL
jgi:hypothetical protein